MEPSTSKEPEELPANDEAPVELIATPVVKKKRKKSRKIKKAEGERN